LGLAAEEMPFPATIADILVRFSPRSRFRLRHEAALFAELANGSASNSDQTSAGA